jgi:hypothetical protein
LLHNTDFFYNSFIESTKLGKKQRDKMDEIHKRNPEDYSFFATFVFSLQSTASLTTLGFKDVPTYTPTPPPAKPPKTKKSKKSVQAEADDEDEPEDDGASEGEEPKKKEKKPEPKQDPEPKSKSKPQPKASELKSKKSKALLSTFGPQPAGFDILNSLFPPKPKVPMSKEAGKSLSFSRSEMFSGELPVQQAVDDAPASSFNTDSQPIKYTDPVTEENSNKVKAKVADDKTQQKGLLLHGEIGGPAHRAFLARGSTQDTESQSQPQVDSMEMTIETGITAPSTSAVIDGETSAHTKDALDLIEVIQAQASLINESPEFEPLTPPVSAKKDLPQRDMESILAERLLNTSPSPISQLQPTQMSQDKPSTFSQATTASTQDCRSQLEIIHPEPSVNIDKMIKDLEALSRESEVRALSPALSEATEVAGPLEIMESVKNSQRTSHGSYQYAQSNQKSSFNEDKSSGYHTIASPTLGSAKTTREDDSMPHIKTGDVREQVRESWQYRSPTSSFSQAEKRKADAITGQERSETEQPRKTAVAPSLGRTSLEEKMMAAKAKLAAATERNRKLEEERQAALLIKKKNDEVRGKSPLGRYYGLQSIG